MVLKEVSYTNFRNIGRAELSFEPGVNVLYGENAQGKTNALEGIYLCAQGRSHRTAHEKDYIGYGQDFAKVGLIFEDRVRRQELELRYLANGRKYCKKNGLPLRKMSEFIGNFRAVIFCPEHLAIVKEGPGERRNYLDAALCQTDARYLSELQEYALALRQRNALIAGWAQDQRLFAETQEFFARQMAKSSAILSQKRAEYVEKADRIVSEIFADMTGGGERPQLRYRKQCTEEELLKLYLNDWQKEIRAGTSLYGVHKDDIEILLNDRPARVFASQGQQKSIAVALKLTEGLLSKEKTGEYPVFLLDDVLSELDAKRQQFVLGGLENKQVIITCCDRSALKNMKGRVILVENGRYQTVR